MAKNSKNKEEVKGWKERFNSTGGIILICFGIFSAGFGTGTAVLNIFHKIDINEINQEHNEKLYAKVKEFDDLIQELRNENQLLKVENEKLKK